MPIFSPTSEVNLYYELHGPTTAPPLLLIHGFMGTGATEFPTLLPWLAKSYRVILPDLRGYGGSSPKPRAYGLDFYQQDADDLAGLLKHLDVRAVRVMGYSDGGETALWLPLLAPDHIQAVVTWGATGHFDDSIKPALLNMLTMRWRTPQTDLLHGTEHISPMTHQWVYSMIGMIDRGGDVTFSRAKEIPHPTLIILGDRDFLNPVARGAAMAAALPNGRFQMLRRTGHAVHIERPWRFRWAVRRFLGR